MIGATRMQGGVDFNATTTLGRDLNAPVERVFDAFRKVDALQHWFRPDPEIQLRVRDLEFRVGGRFVFDYVYPDGTTKTLRGKYIDIAAPTRIEFSWVWDAPDEHQGIETRVEIDLARRGANTRLTVVHTKLPQGASSERYQVGWAACMDALEIWIRKISI